MSLYSGYCRSSVPINPVALVAYHTVVHFHHADRPCALSSSFWCLGFRQWRWRAGSRRGPGPFRKGSREGAVVVEKGEAPAGEYHSLTATSRTMNTS
ncbi:hypothetical protein BHM03_00015416 [Ensete ventricosum]|uniref:Uncharacterized protein n=1 Tax=Ensete ventricosum TaxID=4639 RepID=A0A445MEL4_ENSVE|nr:hypothetical protein BHM03_00015416 [Ensete ventricosum]